MPTFTGALGLATSRPGEFQPGAIGAAETILNASASVVVSTEAVAAIEINPLRLTIETTIAVEGAPEPRRDSVVALTTSVVVSPSQGGLAGQARVTQFAAEFIYRRSTEVSVVHEIAVASEGRQEGRIIEVTVVSAIGTDSGATAPQYRHAVADPVVVSQTLGALNTVRRLSVASTIGVASVAAGRNTNVRVSVVTAMGVGGPATGRDHINRRTVVDDADVATLARPVESHIGELVVDAALVGAVWDYYVSPWKVSMGDLLDVVPEVRGGAPLRRVSVEDVLVLGETFNPQRPAVSVATTVQVSTTLGGGPASRSETVAHAFVVGSFVDALVSVARLSVTDRIGVSHLRVARTPYVEASASSAIVVAAEAVGVAPRRLTVADAIVVSHERMARGSTVRKDVVADIMVATPFRSNFAFHVVESTVGVVDRPALFEHTVYSRLVVSAAPTRIVDATVVETVTVTPSPTRVVVRAARITDALPPVETLVRAVTYPRAIIHDLPIPEGTYRRRIFLPDAITVPVAEGALVTKYLLLESPTRAITLPPPLLGDGLDNADSVLVHRAMNGGALVFKKTSLRRRLRLMFRVDKIKAFELRLFLQESLSVPLRMTTHDAQKWVVVVPEAPFEIQNAGRAEGADEFSTVEIVFEGEKISG